MIEKSFDQKCFTIFLVGSFTKTVNTCKSIIYDAKFALLKLPQGRSEYDGK